MVGFFRLLRCVFVGLLTMLLLAVAGFFGAGTILTWPAGEPDKADVVVVLGGGSSLRYARAVQLLDEGWAPHLLLINAAGSTVKDAERQFSPALGTAAVSVDNGPRNSWQEAQAVKARMLANGWRHALVVSDPPHMLRLRYAWSSVLRGSGLSCTLIATRPAWWSAWHWRNNRQAIEFVASEWLKLGYYILRYQFGLLDGMEPKGWDGLVRLEEG